MNPAADRGLLLAAAVVAGVAVAIAARKESGFYPGDMPGLGGSLPDLLGMVVDSVGYLGVVRISAMRGLSSDALSNRNVKAMLAVIRHGEGTSGPDGYRTLFGGKLFSGYAAHPNIKVCRTFSNGKKVCSTAAGAYQFLKSSWDETAAAMKLKDFGPASQDFAAVGRMAARGALKDVIAGRIDSALSKLSYEWASLPGSPYGQPVLSRDTAHSIFWAAGGLVEGVKLV